MELYVYSAQYVPFEQGRKHWGEGHVNRAHFQNLPAEVWPTHTENLIT